MNINKCDMCPRKCGINRERSELGICGGGNKIEIAWYGLHFGEEPVISGGGLARRSLGKGGSGTIFFCHCNLKCVFCQNWQISQRDQVDQRDKKDQEYTKEETIKIMLGLQEQGANNINLVSPTIWAFWLKDVLLEAKKQGLKIPIVWNSNGFENVGVLRELGDVGAVDIYLPDYKYDDEKLAIKYSSVPDYPRVAREAILEMQRQVGDLTRLRQAQPDFGGQRGLIVRHLVLPGQIENTISCLRFIRSISPDIHLSLMSQYNPVYKARNFPEINRTLTKEEYERVLEKVRDLGFENGWMQEFEGVSECLTPDFNKEDPFVK